MGPHTPGLRDLNDFGDDIQRSAKLENASEEELQALVEAVSPHWDLINSWVEEANEQNPVPDEAVLLSWLARAWQRSLAADSGSLGQRVLPPLARRGAGDGARIHR